MRIAHLARRMSGPIGLGRSGVPRLRDCSTEWTVRAHRGRQNRTAGPRRWAGCSGYRFCQSCLDCIWCAVEYPHQADRGWIRSIAPLLPILQGSNVEAEKVGVFALGQAATAAHFSDVNRISGYRQPLPQFDVHSSEFARERVKVFGLRDCTGSPAKGCQLVYGVMCLLQRQSRSEEPARDGHALVEGASSMQHDNDRFVRRQGRAGLVPDRPQTCESRLQFGVGRHQAGPLPN